MRRTIGVIVTILLLTFSVGVSAELWTPDTEAAYTQYGWISTAATTDDSHFVTIGVVLAGDNKETMFTSAVPFDQYNDQSYHYKSEALINLLKNNTFVEIIFNKDNEVINFERVLNGISMQGGMNVDAYYHDSMKYGGELTAPGGKSGNMVAQGWVMAAEGNTITLGDGNHLVSVFEETYNIAEDAVIYLVDNPGKNDKGEEIGGTWVAEYATLDDIKVTSRDEDGEVYKVLDRNIAMAIFDESAVEPETGNTRKDVSGAKVKELYIFKNNAPVRNSVAPDDVGYNGTSWMPGQDKSVGTTTSGWNGVCTAFPVLDERLFSVGDAFTNIFLFASDADETGDKTLTVLDMGNATSAYQYYANIEKMGYDPRDIDNILLTHGHGDHYGALWEINTMINRAHGYDKLVVWTSGADQAGYLSGVFTGITLTSVPERWTVDHFNAWNEWVPFGAGVDVYPVATPGHANDVASFIFLLNTKENDTYFSKLEDGSVNTAWVYMGGYGGGASTKAENGYTKLQYTTSMRYLQSVVVPYAESVAPYLYNIPQHADQAPWYEVAKAVRMLKDEGKDVHFLDAWNEGRESIINLLEKRASAYSYQWMNSAWKATEATEGAVPVDLYDQTIVPYIREAGFDWFCTPQNKKTESTELFGPWKRQAGTYRITVDSALTMHGFDAMQNKTETLAGIKNIYGWDIGNGISVDKDSYAHDPNGWYVQLVGRVDDDYIGGVYLSDEDALKIAKMDGKSEAYPVNWFVAAGNSYKNFDGEDVTVNSGPIESMQGDNWVEIIRTQRLNTKEEAEALAAFINDNLSKGINTFEVSLNAMSDIRLPEGYISAANAPLDDQFITSLNEDSVKLAFPGTGYYTLQEEPLVIEACVKANEGIDLTAMLSPVR